MTRPAAPSSTPASPGAGRSALAPLAGLRTALVGGTILCLALITWGHPGATRMHASPWSIAYINALLLPAFLLAVRAFDARRPLVLPGGHWLTLVIASALTILLSALFSPYQASALLWSAPLLSALAVFLVTFDWLHTDPARAAERRERVRLGMFSFLAVTALVSVVLWTRAVRLSSAEQFFATRNLWPLGHPNYTAGLALLLLPVAVDLVRRRRGRWQITAAASVVLALFMLFTSGSRGGLIGLGMLVLAAWIAAPLSRRKKWQVGLIGALAALVFAVAHPRTRAMFLPDAADTAPNISNVQRAAMFVAGGKLGSDRPLLGWGPGTTPLAFPRYRAELDGGAENVLQLHSLPMQIWAELGLAGVACALGFAVLFVRSLARDAAAVVALAGYGVFALTDWQLDVPIFAGALAILSAFLALPMAPTPLRLRHFVGATVIGCLLVLLALARRDPAPDYNVRALALARDPAHVAEATALFRESLALNPDQEIAHFNLGWLLVVSEPSVAEHHFLAAAHLVPDKGGVYFGLGLARLNQDRHAAAAHAFALETLNDPAFLTSPWWRESGIALVRDATAAELNRLLQATSITLPPDSWAAKQVPKFAQRVDQLGRVPAGPERSYRRERTGYPVLMRNLDLPFPLDLFDVRELVTPPDWAATLPPKGWLPSPFLLSSLDTPLSK